MTLPAKPGKESSRFENEGFVFACIAISVLILLVGGATFAVVSVAADDGKTDTVSIFSFSFLRHDLRCHAWQAWYWNGNVNAPDTEPRTWMRPVSVADDSPALGPLRQSSQYGWHLTATLQRHEHPFSSDPCQGSYVIDAQYAKT